MIQQFVCFLFLTGISTLAVAQEYSDPADRTLMQKMEEGAALMNQGNYTEADIYFQQVLEEIAVVPADLCFYFGKNSYHLKKYKQSIDWLNKYIELKGTQGQFFDQATEYLRLSEADYTAKQRSAPVSQASKNKSRPKIVDCESTPFILCPVCQGSGVIVEQGSLGNSIYRTCPYSDEQGRMPCSNYQDFLRGNPVPLESED